MSEIIVEEGRPPALRLLYLIMDIVEGLLLLRFLLKLLGANPANIFVNFIYSITRPIVAPFVGLLPIPPVGLGTIEWASLIAIAASGLLFIILARILRIFMSTY